MNHCQLYGYPLDVSTYKCELCYTSKFPSLDDEEFDDYVSEEYDKEMDAKELMIRQHHQDLWDTWNS